MTAADLRAVGVDPTSFDANKQPDGPGAGVTCVLHTMSVTIFAGDAYGSMLQGWQQNGVKNGMLAAEGPAVGGAFQWSTMGKVHLLMFQSANKRYAANLTGGDQARVAQLARVLAANMETH